MQQDIWGAKRVIGFTNPTPVSSSPSRTHVSAIPLSPWLPSFPHIAIGPKIEMKNNTEFWSTPTISLYCKNFPDLDHQVNYLKHKVRLRLQFTWDAFKPVFRKGVKYLLIYSFRKIQSLTTFLVTEKLSLWCMCICELLLTTANTVEKQGDEKCFYLISQPQNITKKQPILTLCNSEFWYIHLTNIYQWLVICWVQSCVLEKQQWAVQPGS